MIIKVDNFIRKMNTELKSNIEKLEFIPKLQLVRIGNDIGAKSFEKSIFKEAKKIGIDVDVKIFYKCDSESEIIEFIEQVNEDNTINGILLFLPIDNKFNQRKILNTISPKKDVDGLNIKSLAKLFITDEYRNVPTTALSTLEFLQSLTNLEGKDVLVINRSLIIGKPLYFMLSNENATVQMAHSKTADIYEKMANADIIISAIGKPKFFKTEKFKKDAIIVDLGVSTLGGLLYGDFDSSNYENLDIKYVPSIGGVGKINSNMILKNTYRNGVEND
ncbi:tetrahydrofolate dehydrogenase/cyclohydrolase catalytic domain-containing protein [Helcococcus kunzii]|uniref:Methenyltetrahydrofolate cyclohydrolase n=1 Tax=Helcococcus kunzii ATCC 51366 TaxID=883114 RepID=H3NMD2_9FIRM|nr:bifunctional 5,10-methylenetetrahydrofolate dehydrogenase/5,10-methenyltetrahydrofolate cyclohydrolase [Helcococcus kunzii]EHR35067.1 hypothetical protein HMPREF9709_00493 [Helcococcus kunzii ATCC 51366]QUY64448.1 bifunctional 5,10-methylenetetrahydrofolate dehydrogenase/5,10-methenyltetrahydrofolate cyclohydrolase [Helcococcus kunzii]